MRISVIVPVGPEGSYLPELMDSLAAQSLPPDEVVVINDAAPPSALECLKITNEPEPVIRGELCWGGTSRGLAVELWNNPWRLGEVASRNIGTSVASNDWVFQASHDDLLYPDCLRLCAEAAEASENPGRQGYYYTVLALGRMPWEIDSMQGEPGAHALFHRSLWAYLGGYPLCGSLGLADIGFIDLVGVHGGHYVRVDDRPLYWHRTHALNQLAQTSGVMRELCRQAANETTARWVKPTWVERFGYA